MYKTYKIMPFIYRWAKGEDKARELAEKVSRVKGWRRCETTATCASVTCQMYEFKLPGDKYYKSYWLCYQSTNEYPADYDKWDTTIGFCTDKDFPQLPIKRLKDGLERIYQ